MNISMNVCPGGFGGNAAQFLKTNRHQFFEGYDINSENFAICVL